ncbi:DNA-directed DNA polymerase alpha catalytic subunit pol1 [Mycoblastus sanguinarius]|nr:DNA-directed DNA polymerase alpha catalytic subunit pol1 [Mycoblastus sanguinarius]
MSRASRLAELRALRESGKTRLSTYKVEEEENLYEEVDEEGYKKVVRARLDRDDFVIDDNGEGYADDGREEWMGERHYDSASGSEEELPLKGKAAKRKREENKEKMERTNNRINKYFSNGPIAAAPKPKPVVTVEDAAFMADLLGEVDTNIPSRQPLKTIKTASRRKTRVLSPPVSREKKISLPKHTDVSNAGSLLNTPPLEANYNDDDGFLGGMDDDVFSPGDLIPSSPTADAVDRKSQLPIKVEEDDEDMMEVAQVIGNHKVNSASVNMSGSRPAPKVVKAPAYPSPASSSPTRPPAEVVDASAWNDVTSKLNVLSSQGTETLSFGKLKIENATEDDGSLRFFWTDYTEVNGSLCLFGKVKDKNSGAYVSAFLKVDNILRKLYFLPRTYRQKHGRDTSDEVEMSDVYQEVDEVMTKLRVGMHKIKPCSRKYAFELSDIPKEADYLKLMYPYDKPGLPVGMKGDTFSHVFGTTTALFEQFVLWKNIMGPCWLGIEDAEFAPLNNASWCKFEIQVSSPKAITALKESDNMDAPPLNFMSIALRTTLNVKENKQEILVASARVYENISLTDTTRPEDLPCKTYTIMRPADGSFPTGFDTLTKKQRGTIMLEKTENILLAKFLALLERADPDVLMGHQLQDVDYPILLSRFRERKTPGWHRVGRLRRHDWPKNMGKGGGSFFTERQLVAGRLLCDVANDMGKSLMTKCQSWSLTEMCELYLGEGSPRREIDNDVALKTWATSREGLLNYVNHCEADTYFVTAIALKVQMLPLTKVLTNLAGNSWARTLSGTRAERNEYILLHEFNRNKYICPDKIYGKGKIQVEEDAPEGEEGVDVKKKDKFKGGLVFEPEKGLYDKFILVMDFNSLYPSIIQEYNICFTTVDRSDQSEDNEKVPDVPADQNQGILPKLIATLVSRRRQVKGLMKDKKATAEQIATWDIKQTALKLTANSMYGCLGYTQSRFYARPLAMLTTFKGREILRSTKDLAESTQLRVIYGDTDSVMINTNADNIEEALKVGVEFKRSVNERYKLLEIDIDNIFRRLLLHAKKKYAAINMLEVDGKYVDKLEVKGLDMKRREYCALSKEASSRLLNLILSGEEPEVVVGKVHEYLRELSERMREEKVPAQKYIIFTKLGKNPKDYPNPDSMPQVQVALRALAQGKNVRINDVISYIMTATSGSAAPHDSTAKRAYAPADVTSTSSTLKPDVEWYLYKQIFPPIERLCAPMLGTDAVHLAECLGLDTRKYSIASSSSTNQTQEISPLESQIPDSIRFKDCIRLTLKCRYCKHAFTFEGLAASITNVTPEGITCPSESCRRPFPTLTLVAQLEHAIRIQTSRYYDGYLICDDSSCNNRTRQMSVYGHRCLGPKGRAESCLGRMRYEMSEKDMYNQLLYYRGVWDVEKDAPKGEGEEMEKMKAAAEFNRERFGTCRGVVEGYLKRCGRVWVQMDGLFGFAMER